MEYSEEEILHRYRRAYSQPWGKSRLRFVLITFRSLPNFCNFICHINKFTYFKLIFNFEDLGFNVKSIDYEIL